MISAMKEIRCFSCGASVPETNGPVHRYMDSAPGCWAAYGEVLTREYSDALYAGNHKLTVDAYAVQHPGGTSPQAVQSVALHLVRLCLILEYGVNQPFATRFLQKMAANKSRYFRLNPPGSMGNVTVRDVLNAEGPGEHQRMVREWAESAWLAWKDSHDRIRQWAEPALR